MACENPSLDWKQPRHLPSACTPASSSRNLHRWTRVEAAACFLNAWASVVADTILTRSSNWTAMAWLLVDSFRGYVPDQSDGEVDPHSPSCKMRLPPPQMTNGAIDMPPESPVMDSSETSIRHTMHSAEYVYEQQNDQD